MEDGMPLFGAGEVGQHMPHVYGGVLERYSIQKYMCKHCAFDDCGDLKANGAAQAIDEETAASHLLGADHLRRVADDTRPLPPDLVAGPALRVHSVWRYRCRPCQLDGDATIHTNPRHWCMTEATLHAHCSTADHRRRVADCRFERYVAARHGLQHRLHQHRLQQARQQAARAQQEMTVERMGEGAREA